MGKGSPPAVRPHHVSAERDMIYQDSCDPYLAVLSQAKGCSGSSMLLRLSLVLQVITALAEETRSAVQAEETKAKAKAQTAHDIADDAQRDLDEALPALDAALANLRNHNKSDVTEVSGLRGEGGRAATGPLQQFPFYRLAASQAFSSISIHPPIHLTGLTVWAAAHAASQVHS